MGHLKRIPVSIKTISPVNFAEKNNDSTLYATKSYISGTAIRGMLANLFIQAQDDPADIHKDPSFFRLFLSGQVRFLPAYPSRRENPVPNEETFILPLSLMRSKDGKTVQDLSLVDNKPRAGFKKMTGFAARKGNILYYPISVRTQIELHMARSLRHEEEAIDPRIKGNRDSGGIFNYEYIEPGQVFQGYILADNDIADEVMSFLDKRKFMGAGRDIRIGRSKNVQYGQCRCQAFAEEDCPYQEIDTQKMCYLYAYTPYIPWAEWQNASTIANDIITELEEQLKKYGYNVTLHLDHPVIFSSKEETTGYVAAWKARRERRYALSAGSLLQIDISQMDTSALNALQELLFSGIGYRTQEGYGQFRLWQPLQTIHVKDAAADCSEMISEIDGDAVFAVRRRAVEVMKLRLEEIISSQAGWDAKRINARGIGKHILSRLESELLKKNTTQQHICNYVAFTLSRQAKDNLKHIWLDTSSLYDVLCGKVADNRPWEKDWMQYLEIHNIEELQKLLQQSSFINSDDAFRLYWLWFVRHAKKGMDN